jgi:hypothetical protein
VATALASGVIEGCLPTAGCQSKSADFWLNKILLRGYDAGRMKLMSGHEHSSPRQASEAYSEYLP